MTSQELESVKTALITRFAGAIVDSEQIGPNGRYRLAVVSDEFTGMTHLARQDAIWEVVDSVLSREATLDISIILAFAPADLVPTK